MPHNNPLEELDKSWYVITVKNNQQKKIVRQLTEIGIEAFCPFKKEIRQWSDRKKTVEVPILMNYIFVRLPEEERNNVFSIPGIIKYLFWLGKPAIARGSEIETMKKWINDEEISSFKIKTIQPGRKVKIENGPLKDKNATVQQVRKSELKLILQDLGIIVIAKKKSVA